MTGFKALMLLVVVMTVAGGCGQQSDRSASGLPLTTRVDGLFTVDKAMVAGVAVDRVNEFQITVDAEHHGLRLVGPCSTLYGAMTLLDDQRAGVTLAGGTARQCDEADSSAQVAMLDLLGRVNHWALDAEALRFDAANGDSLTLSP